MRRPHKMTFIVRFDDIYNYLIIIMSKSVLVKYRGIQLKKFHMIPKTTTFSQYSFKRLSFAANDFLI
jgi:hypothetical protein